MIRAVIFDLDGTLVNAYRAVAASVNHTLWQIDLPLRSYAEIRRAVGFGDRCLLAGFVGPQRAPEALRIYRAHHAMALAAKGGVFLLPGVKALLLSLRRREISLVIATNRPRRFTGVILKVLAIRDFFDIVLSPEVVPRPKPHPDILLEAITRLGLTKAQVLFVGDMDIDVNTGRRARVRTVAVATGSCGRKELKALHPYRVLDKIAPITNIIKELNDEQKIKKGQDALAFQKSKPRDKAR